MVNSKISFYHYFYPANTKLACCIKLIFRTCVSGVPLQGIQVHLQVCLQVHLYSIEQILLPWDLTCKEFFFIMTGPFWWQSASALTSKLFFLPLLSVNFIVGIYSGMYVQYSEQRCSMHGSYTPHSGLDLARHLCLISHKPK